MPSTLPSENDIQLAVKAASLAYIHPKDQEGFFELEHKTSSISQNNDKIISSVPFYKIVLSSCSLHQL